MCSFSSNVLFSTHHSTKGNTKGNKISAGPDAPWFLSTHANVRRRDLRKIEDESPGWRKERGSSSRGQKEPEWKKRLGDEATVATVDKVGRSTLENRSAEQTGRGRRKVVTAEWVTEKGRGLEVRWNR
uniref:uncharacterized protein LOC117611801 isoform X1 n=1 Tax=Osmia lignaria TaxID=473952 RepID=UPI00147954A2|nr:uncharacterized protein LOC117611801 isoform X1 [Osmia lignaria]